MKLIVCSVLVAVAMCQQGAVKQPIPVVSNPSVAVAAQPVFVANDFGNNDDDFGNNGDNFGESDNSENSGDDGSFPQPSRGSQNNFDARASNRISCGFSCSRRATLLSWVDDVFSQAECGDSNADLKTRCSGCCAARGLASGISTDRTSAFIGSNGRDCICCHSNNRC